MILVFLTYDETFTLKGYGLNLRGGLIYRPKEYIRLGLAVHTPTWMPLKETTSSGFAADLENLFGAGHGYDSVGMATITGGSEKVENKISIEFSNKDHDQWFLCFQRSGRYNKTERFYYSRY